jgi:hypothetical protein
MADSMSEKMEKELAAASIDENAEGAAEAAELAEFIAKMRAEVFALERQLAASRARETALEKLIQATGMEETRQEPPVEKAAPEVAGVAPVRGSPPPAEGIEEVLKSLHRAADRNLVGVLLKELTSPRDSSCLWAAARLVDYLGPRAAPFVAEAARRCSCAETRAALIRQLGRTADASVYDAAAAFAEDASGLVRVAALDACADLAGDRTEEWMELLRRSGKDPDPLIRRRAIVHISSMRGIDPGLFCAPLLKDPDPTIRRLASAALSGTRDIGSILGLLETLLDPNERVAEAAEVAAGRLLGRSIKGLCALAPEEKAARVARLCAYVSASRSSLVREGCFEPSKIAWLIPEEKAAETNPLRMLRDVAPAQKPGSAKDVLRFHQVFEVLQSSLRGCTEEVLAKELDCDPGALAIMVREHERSGRLVRRGERYFLP